MECIITFPSQRLLRQRAAVLR